jgi:hypothetical protein
MGNNKITSITILQDDACKDKQEPFKSYATLKDMTIVKASLSDEAMTAGSLQAALSGKSFDFIGDNASNNPTGERCKIFMRAVYYW